MTSKWVGQRPGTTAGDGFHPRVELHIHLDGSIEPAALLPIAQRRKLVLPGIDAVPTSVEDIWTALLSMHPGWRIFDLVNEIIGGEEQTLVEIAEAFVDQQAARGVAYTEVRWDPVRPAVSHLANVSISVEAAIRAVERGLKAGSERHGIEVHQLLCAMRGSPGAAVVDTQSEHHSTDRAPRLRAAPAGGASGTSARRARPIPSGNRSAARLP